MPSSSSKINNKSTQEEKVLYTQKGVHLDIALRGCWDKDKMAAAPTPSATRFPQTETGWQLLPTVLSLSLSQEQKNNGQTVKARLSTLSHTAASDAGLGSSQLWLALVSLPLTASSRSAWLLAAWVRLSWGVHIWIYNNIAKVSVTGLL